jgi:hypothetical protein
MRKCALPARPSHELDPISAMSWGGEPVRRDQQGKSTIRMQALYATADEIASGKKFGDQRPIGTPPDAPASMRLARHDPPTI